MTTLYQNSSVGSGDAAARDNSYNGYIEPDTRVPPKAHPVLTEISVNGVAISEAAILAETQNHPAENPGAALIAAARALVVRELLLQEARRLNVEPRPETSAEGRMETPEDAAIRLLIESEIDAPRAGEEECRRFYDNNPARFQSEAICEARHILIAAPPEDRSTRAAARKTAKELIAHLTRHPVDFATLAAAHSACPSGEHGGNLGQLTRGATVPEFERALDFMQTGELLTRPVESRFGFHIILLERKIEGAQLPFEAVKDRIAGWLEAASWSKAIAQYITVLAGRADIRGLEILAADGPLIQ